jgi:general stress protein 26
MKLVINTQYRENYAAHDEDYVHGVSEAYWKFKGGTTYVVPNFTDSVNITEVMKNLTTLIEYGNAGSEEYILGYEIFEDNAKVCENWETVTQVFYNTDNVTALKVTDNREDGWMRSEILEKTEAWTMLPESKRGKYAASYLMRDGDICESQKDLENWFDTCGQVEVV